MQKFYIYEMKRKLLRALALPGLVMYLPLYADAQDATTDLTKNWGYVRTAMQRTADMANNFLDMYNGLVATDPKEMKPMRDMVMEFKDYLAAHDGMPDSLTVHTSWDKLEQLKLQVIAKMTKYLLSIKGKNTEKLIRSIQSDVEASENLLYQSGKTFNRIARQYNRPELVRENNVAPPKDE